MHQPWSQAMTLDLLKFGDPLVNVFSAFVGQSGGELPLWSLRSSQSHDNATSVDDITVPCMISKKTFVVV